MRSIIDISIPVNEKTPVWPGDESIRIWRTDSISLNDDFNISRIEMGVHTGTHIDAPYHVFLEGDYVEAYPLEQLVGEVSVVELNAGIKLITKEVLEKYSLKDVKRLLIKTENSSQWNAQNPEFTENFTAINTSGAKYLTALGICLLGIDFFSISPLSDLAEPHRILLHQKIAIIENLDLRNVEAGKYLLYCLPMKLTGVDGAPVRAILQTL